MILTRRADAKVLRIKNKLKDKNQSWEKHPSATRLAWAVFRQEKSDAYTAVKICCHEMCFQRIMCGTPFLLHSETLEWRLIALATRAEFLDDHAGDADHGCGHYYTPCRWRKESSV